MDEEMVNIIQHAKIVKIRTKEFYRLHKNDPKYKERKRRNAEKWKKNHQYYIKNWNDTLSNEYVLIKTAKRRAREYNLVFDLKIEDIFIPQICPILGIPLFRSKGIHTANSPSIDRIEPKLGYVKENIQIISHKANAMKNNATIDELIKFAKWVLNATSTVSSKGDY
jgi:hypothetical protein